MIFYWDMLSEDFLQITYLFLQKLKCHLLFTQQSLVSFVKTHFGSDKPTLSLQQFLQIDSDLQIKVYVPFDPNPIFADLAKQQATLQLVTLQKYLDATNESLNLIESREVQEQLKSERTLRGQYIVQDYMKDPESNILQCLQAFDEDKNQLLSKAEFNKLLIAADIGLSSQVIKLILDKVYAAIGPHQQIAFADILKYFQIGLSQVGGPDTLPASKQTEEKPTTQSRLSVGQSRLSVSQSRLSVGQSRLSAKLSQSGLNWWGDSLAQRYPNAIKYLNKLQVESFEYQHMQQLENLLLCKKQYRDKQRPTKEKRLVYVSATHVMNLNYEIFNSSISVVLREKSRIGRSRYIQPKDVIQGQLGNCFFLSAIASIAQQYPEVMHEKFLFIANPANYYPVRLFIDGEWKYITTDQFFPCRKKQNDCYELAYAQPHGPQLWVMLLEKCWAKVYDSYRALNGGLSMEAFTVLTGAPCQNISINDIMTLPEPQRKEELERVFRILQRKKGSIAAVGICSQKVSEEELAKVRLYGQHCYSFLRMIVVNGQKLLRLRNPYSTETWKGEWSFGSKQWTEQLKEKYNYHNDKRDGSFYIKSQDFLRYFDQIILCKLNTQYLHTSIRQLSNRHKSAYFLLEIKNKGNYTFTIYQQNKRKYKKTKFKPLPLKHQKPNNEAATQDYQYSPARLIIMQFYQQSLNYVDSRTKSDSQDCSVSGFFPAGNYLMSAKVSWKYWEDHQFVLTSYGQDLVNFEQLDRVIAPKFKEQLIKSYEAKFGNKTVFTDLEAYTKIPSLFGKNLSLTTGVGFFKYVNKSSRPVRFVFKCKEFKGLKFIKPETYPHQAIVEPQSSLTVGLFISNQYHLQGVQIFGQTR